MESSEITVNTEVMPKTIYESFCKTATLHSEKVALMYKGKDNEYEGITYKELNDLVNRVAASVKNLGIKKGDKVAIFSYNRPEWVIVDLAVLKLGGIVVPIYHTLSSSAVKHIINDSGSKLIFVENAEFFNTIDSIRNESPCLTAVVTFDTREIDTQKDFLIFSNLESDEMQVEKSIFDDLPPISADDAATIVYTSGTTGEPKGAVLSHHNIVSNAFSAIKRFRITSEDVFLSFLPLCHMFERTCGYYTAIFVGGSIGYAKDISTVAEDIKKVRPTILLVVPRVIEKAYDTSVKKVEESSPIKKALVLSAIRNLNEYANLKYKKMNISLGLRMKCGIYNSLVASKFKKIAGGKLRLLVSGGAPLNRQVAKVFYILGFNIVEGYGLTETSPVVCSGAVEGHRLGTVGKPFDDVEIRIGENDEILVRGPNVMKGYFNRPEETTRAIDKEGWFHTGDKGKLDEDGNLIITGRIKEIIVTSYGKNVAPVPIEAEITKSSYITQVVLYGDNKKYITALIVPEREPIERYAKERNILVADYKELLDKDNIKKLIANEIKKATVNFAPFEKVKAFTLLPESFTIENSMLTPTLKLRRPKIIERYRSEIDSMYAQTEGR